MLDCFISYSKDDQQKAEMIWEALRRRGVSVFQASLSIQPGQEWSPEIRSKLKASDRVILLASRSACASPYVNQEIGGAVFDSKPLVPIVWDMPPTALPGWAKDFHAIDLTGATREAWFAQIDSIATDVIATRRQRFALLGLITLLFFAFGGK